MPYLKYYQNLDKTFREERIHMFVVGQKEAIKIINKLCRHYKVPKVKVIFRKRRPNSGTYKPSSGIISLHPEKFSIEVICHEVAHHIQYLTGKKNVKWHTKKHLTILKRLLKYCAKMEYWGWLLGMDK